MNRTKEERPRYRLLSKFSISNIYHASHRQSLSSATMITSVSDISVRSLVYRQLQGRCAMYDWHLLFTVTEPKFSDRCRAPRIFTECVSVLGMSPLNTCRLNPSQSTMVASVSSSQIVTSRSVIILRGNSVCQHTRCAQEISS